MITIDSSESAIIAQFSHVPPAELNSLVFVYETYGHAPGFAKVFEGVVGIALRSDDEIRRGVAMARAARHGNLLNSSPCAVRISGDGNRHEGYLFSVQEELWVSVSARTLNFRLLCAANFEKMRDVLAPTEIRNIFIAIDEHGFFWARMVGDTIVVKSSGALYQFYYGPGPNESNEFSFSWERSPLEPKTEINIERA